MRHLVTIKTYSFGKNVWPKILLCDTKLRFCHDILNDTAWRDVRVSREIYSFYISILEIGAELFDTPIFDICNVWNPCFAIFTLNHFLLNNLNVFCIILSAQWFVANRWTCFTSIHSLWFIINHKIWFRNHQWWFYRNFVFRDIWWDDNFMGTG